MTVDQMESSLTSPSATTADTPSNDAAFSSMASSSADLMLHQPQSPTGSGLSSHNSKRTRLPVDTVAAFEAVFQTTKTPPSNIMQDLAHQFSLDISKVRTWFNNRKAKEKRILASTSLDVSSAGVARTGGRMSSASGGRPRGDSATPPPSTMHLTSPTTTAAPASVAAPPIKGTANPSDHVLHTTAGFSFSIDETPVDMTLDHFYAMRDRIVQLEDHIAQMHYHHQQQIAQLAQQQQRLLEMANNAAASAAAAATTSSSASVKRGASGEPDGVPTAKRLNVGATTVQHHLNQIGHRLHAELNKQAASASSGQIFSGPDNVVELVLNETMTVDEFVAVFDEKGGKVSAIPKDPSNPMGETLVAVEFATPEIVHALLGTEAVRMLTLDHSNGTKTSCQVRWMHALYDKNTAQVSMNFKLAPLSS